MGIKGLLVTLMCVLQMGLVSAAETGPVAGVFSQKVDNILFYATSADIKPDQSLRLLDRDGNYSCCLVVTGKPVIKTDTPLSSEAGGPISGYPVKLQREAVKHFKGMTVFGVALRRNTKVVDSSSDTYTLLYAGKKTRLTLCTSQEGVHIRSLSYDDEKVLTHLYYYLGYDVEPTCK
jgi:hypothetical protein